MQPDPGTVWLPTNPPRPAPPLLTAEEVALLLRLDGPGGIAYYRRHGLIPGVRVGKAVRYRLTDVMAFINRRQPR